MAFPNQKLAVVSVFWKGFFADRYKFRPDKDPGRIPVYTETHVQKLQSMVSRHLSEPHRFVCLSNTDVSGVETIPLASNLPGWWSKIELFRPDLNLGDRILYLDLDVLVVANLNCLFRLPDDFIAAPIFRGKAIQKPWTRPGINTSVMIWTNGCATDVWERFDSSVPERLQSDQDWIHELYPNLPTIPEKYIRNYKKYNPSGGNQTVVVPCGKPELQAERFPWIDEVWR